MLPVEIKKEADLLAIIWDTGEKSLFEMRLLRKQCPCANCKSMRTSQKENPLKVLSPQEIIPENIEIRDAEIIGRYAIQFTWSDGHREGIYPFDYLRDLSRKQKENE